MACSRKVENRPITPRRLSDSPVRRNVSRSTPVAAARPFHGFSRNSSGSNSRFNSVSTRHSRSLSSTVSVPMITARSSDLLPGSIPRRRTWPTHSANSFFAGSSREATAPVCLLRKSQCFASEYPCGTLIVVHSRYFAPAMAASVERMTTWPEKGSCWNM